jgi:hypothetical protein
MPKGRPYCYRRRSETEVGIHPTIREHQALLGDGLLRADHPPPSGWLDAQLWTVAGLLIEMWKRIGVGHTLAGEHS